jgi:hypothetical protein
MKPSNKVMVYPTATESIDQLQQSGFTRVRNYGSYWVVEATDAQVDELTKMYGARAVKDSRLNRIELGAVSFDTTVSQPTVPAGFQQVDGPGKRLRLVQFRGPVTPEWMQRLRSSGAQVVSYVPNNAYLVQLDKAGEGKLRAMQGPDDPIQWIGPYHPYYKIQKGLWTEGDQKNDSLVNVRVMVVPHSENSDTMKAIEKIGFVENSYNRANQTALFLTVPVSTIAQVARLPDVIWIEKEYPKKLLDEVQDLVLAGQTNGLGHGPEGATTGFTNYLDFLFTQVAGNQIDAFMDPFTYPVVDVADTGIDSGPLRGTVVFGTNRPDVVEAPVHPAFHFLGDARNFSRVVYDGPPWIGGDPDSQLGCANVHLGPNDGPFKKIESMDLVGHGTAVASIIAGYDDGTNIQNQLCLQLLTINSNMVLALPFTDTCGNTLDCPVSGSTNITVCLPMGVTNTCGSDQIFTNVTIALSASACPATVKTNVPFTKVVASLLSSLRRDDNGFQFGMGVSPFGLLGNSRIWQNYQSDLAISGTAPGTGIFGLGLLAVSGGCEQGQFLTELGKCVTDIPSLIALAYFNGAGAGTAGARIQNNSWSDNIGVPPLNGGQYNADCVSYDIAVRDALLVGNSNNVPFPVPGPSPLNQEFIVVFACASSFDDAGNNSGVGGSPDIFITAPATAKNVISVGVADNPRFSECGGGDSQEMPTFAANGPTLDGRFKPEIVAPGANVSAALSQIVAVTTNCSLDKTLFPAYPGIVTCTNPPCDGTRGPIYTDLYRCVVGSSYAAPAVSGAIQLLWWYFQHRLTSEVGQPLLQPSPAMAKAYVCNAARYLPIPSGQLTNVFDTLPSILQGMGELDLARMFDGVGRVIRDESTPRAIDVPLLTTNPAPQQTYFSQSGQSYEVSGQIADSNLPFRVTLAWTDPPGTPFAQQELVNDLDLEVTVGGVTYKGNVFAQNVSTPGGGFDSVNNMESVFLNPVGWMGGIAAVTNGARWQAIVRAKNIAGTGVPNVGEATLGGSNTLNQDFALVVYNTVTNFSVLSDVPNLTTNNSCQTAIDITEVPFTFSNSLTKAVYGNVHPSPSIARGGIDEFFKLTQPTNGVTITIDTFGSSFDNVVSVWSVRVIPQTVFVRGNCGALTEVAANNDSAHGLTTHLSFTADGSNDYYIVVEPHNDGRGSNLVMHVQVPGVPTPRTGKLTTRDAKFWFTHAFSSDNPACATLQRALQANGGGIDLGFLRLPVFLENGDATKDVNDALQEALGFYWKSSGRTGEGGGSQNQKLAGSSLCKQRKLCSIELIAAIANVNLLGTDPSDCGFPSDLLQQARTVLAGDDVTAVVSNRALLKAFNSSGLNYSDTNFPPGVVRCLPNNTKFLKSITRDPTRQNTCPGPNDTCVAAEAVFFPTVDIANPFVTAVFKRSANLKTYHDDFPFPACGAGGRDAVWKVKPNLGVTGRQFTVSTDGSNFDTMLSVWTGDCTNNNLTQVTCTNGIAGTRGERLSFTTDGTNTFFIVGEGATGQSGKLKIKITSP